MFTSLRLKLPQQQMFATETLWAIAALCGGMFAISFAPILIRLGEGELGPNATIFNRFWVATVAFGLWNILLRARQGQDNTIKRQPYSMGVLGLLLAVGIALSLALILWAWSLTQTSVANSTLMHYLMPLFVALGGWSIWGRRFDNKFILGMVIAMAGAGILGVSDLCEANGQLIGDLAALLSAVFFALYTLLVEQLRSQLTSSTIMTWCSATSSILLLPLVIFTEDRLFPYSLSGWLSVIFLALICQALGLGLYGYCLNKLSSGFVSLCDLLVPVLSALEAWAIFSENINGATSICFVVILLGAYLALSSKSAIKL